MPLAPSSLSTLENIHRHSHKISPSEISSIMPSAPSRRHQDFQPIVSKPCEPTRQHPDKQPHPYKRPRRKLARRKCENCRSSKQKVCFFFFFFVELPVPDAHKMCVVRVRRIWMPEMLQASLALPRPYREKTFSSNASRFTCHALVRSHSSSFGNTE
jgi:hypothetical protein